MVVTSQLCSEYLQIWWHNVEDLGEYGQHFRQLLLKLEWEAVIQLD